MRKIIGVGFEGKDRFYVDTLQKKLSDEDMIYERAKSCGYLKSKIRWSDRLLIELDFKM